MKKKNKKYNYQMSDIISFLKKNKKKKNLAEKDFNINTDFSWKKIIN